MDPKCPLCETIPDNMTLHIINTHLPHEVANLLITTHNRQLTQATTISNMQQDAITQNRYVESQQATLNTLRLAHEAATRKIKHLEVETKTAKDARQMAEDEATNLYTNLQHAVDKLAGAEALPLLGSLLPTWGTFGPQCVYTSLNSSTLKRTELASSRS